MGIQEEAELLAQGVQALGLQVSQTQQRQLLALVALLAKWNRAYNLTAVRDTREMVKRHLLDSLAILPQIGTEPLLDVGTGAGIPGLILAVCRPEQSFTLLDSNGKKVRFVKQAALELGLGRVEVVQHRVEQYRGSFPQICCRAFAALPDILASCQHLLAPGGKLLAMKAQEKETEAVPAGWTRRVVELDVPLLNEQRQLWVMTQQD